jgi:hypothetical protein
LETRHGDDSEQDERDKALIPLESASKSQQTKHAKKSFLFHLAGYPREGFPIQMGEIQGQVVAADINGDGYLEIVAVDTRGNVAAFDWRGRELWERHVASMISQASALRSL